MKKHRTHHASSARDCPKRRLAEGDIASVDICGCGMMQLHLGALTLRLAPCAVSDLLTTLGQAVAAHAAGRFGPPREDEPMPSFGTKRGSA